MAYIVVVDDDEIVRSFTARMLERKGHIVARASGGREALELLHEHIPDLILSDIQMPEMDGYGLFQEVRIRYPKIPFVAMSGHLYGEDTGTAQFDAFIGKPFDVDELVKAIEQVLAGQPV